MKIKTFTFNAFEENTYLLYDETGQACIVDPGCNTEEERKELMDFIHHEDLTVTHLVNTHCHIDHVLGNAFVSKYYRLPLTAHLGEQELLSNQGTVSRMYGIPYDPSPDITVGLEGGEILTFGQTSLRVIFAPGHSPAHICLYHESTQQLIAGDVLFKQSIGRTDLPGGDYKTLIKSIKKNLLPLPSETIVYPGHGETTTIGYEALYNPFLNDRMA